jgi:hypothetical protein
LGNATVIDSIKLEWPSGIVETYTNININQFLNYVEGPGVFVKENHSLKEELLVYPNPSVGVITISLSNGEFKSSHKITVLTLTGKVVCEFNTTASKQIQLNTKKYNLSTGEYLLNVTGDEKHFTKKIIIAKD